MADGQGLIWLPLSQEVKIQTTLLAVSNNKNKLLLFILIYLLSKVNYAFLKSHKHSKS